MKIKNLIKTINFFNTKAKNIIKLSKILIKNFNSEVPKTREELQTLPGVGRKTANVILSVAFKKATIAVDTHIFRVSKRLGLIGKKVNVAKAHDLLERQVAPEEVFAFHIYLITHGRQICKAQRPRCGQCVLASGCPSRVSF